VAVRAGINIDPVQAARRIPLRPKFYVLECCRTGGGREHIGQIRNYHLGEALARYKRMRGFNRASPMGWDAFGLAGEKPAQSPTRRDPSYGWDHVNIENMKRAATAHGL